MFLRYFLPIRHTLKGPLQPVLVSWPTKIVHTVSCFSWSGVIQCFVQLSPLVCRCSLLYRCLTGVYCPSFRYTLWCTFSLHALKTTIWTPFTVNYTTPSWSFLFATNYVLTPRGNVHHKLISSPFMEPNFLYRVHQNPPLVSDLHVGGILPFLKFAPTCVSCTGTFISAI
jgi:hypothetical protein